MPIHDWTRVRSGLFHDFHQGWTIRLRNALNAGLLPPGYFAMADQRVSGPETDVVTLREERPISNGALATVPAKPRLRKQIATESSIYARKANRIAVRHELGRVVAAIEIVSPGNKDNDRAIRAFKSKALDFLYSGIHLVIVDLFPPTPRDPDGLHALIWGDLTSEPLDPLPADKPLAVASYEANIDIAAYVDPIAVCDALPDAPLFLAADWSIELPLEATYCASWDETPRPIKELVVGKGPTA